MNDEMNIQELVAEMGLIASEVGDERGHIPYAAACTFNSNADIHSKYAGHVSDCEFCQEVIALYNGGLRNPAEC